MTTILLFSFSCSLQTLSVGWDETNPFTLLLFIVFLHFSGCTRTKNTDDGGRSASQMGRASSSHHSASPQAWYSFRCAKDNTTPLS
jgi:hypothetical protein